MLGNVASGPHGRVQRDTTRRRLAGLVVIALLLHLPATPALAYFGLAQWALERPNKELAPIEEAKSIPISLVAEAALPPPEESEAAEPPPPKPEPQARPKPKPKPKAKRKPKPKPAPKPKPEAKAPKKKGKGKRGDPIGDPVALSGVAGKVVDGNARVRVLVFNDRLRKHKLAPKLGEILANIRQWRDFFGPSGINPVNDLDRILIAGPQLRDSSKLVVVVQHHVKRDRMRDAVAALVKGPPSGRWIDDAPFPAALAHADRAERIVALPDVGVAIIAPKTTQKQVLSIKPGLVFPAGRGQEIVTAYVKEPWRYTNRLFQVPKTIKWLRLVVFEGNDGGAIVRILAEDGSPELAKKHARQLTRDVNKATELDLVLWKERLVRRTRFVAKGKRLEAEIIVTRGQLRSIVDIAYEFLRPSPKRKKANSKLGSPKSASTDGAPAAAAPGKAAPKVRIGKKAVRVPRGAPARRKAPVRTKPAPPLRRGKPSKPAKPPKPPTQ